MFNVGVPEMMVILLVALLVFGPNKLPEMARNMGKMLRNFQQETNRALSDLKQGIEPAKTGIFDQPDAGTPSEESAVPAAAFGAAAGTRRKTSTRTTSARRKPATAAKKKPASAPAKKKAVAKRTPVAKNKPVAKKTTKR